MAFDNAFGEHDALLGRVKRHVLSPWNGTSWGLVEDICKLIMIVSGCDVQYGLALTGALVVVIDLLKRGVQAKIVAKYVFYLRESAADRSGHDDVLKRFFTFDATLFTRAGGFLTSAGEVLCEKPAHVPEVVPRRDNRDNARDQDKRLDRGRGKNDNQYDSWPYSNVTCRSFNKKAGCSRKECSWAHLCAFCHKSHPVVECHEHAGGPPGQRALPAPKLK